MEMSVNCHLTGRLKKVELKRRCIVTSECKLQPDLLVRVSQVHCGAKRSTLDETVRSIDPQLPLAQVQSMERAVSNSEAPRRFNTVVISAFAMAAALLASLCMYGVIAFSAALRAQEMAIRMALGSQRADILRLVFASAAKVAVLGCAIGLLGVAAASRLLGSFLFGVSPFDPLVLSLAVVFVLPLTWLASLLPLRRAASIDLMSVLRAE
jgi:putative ABC transport system permease protein